MRDMRGKGFTLVELLVTISILTLLMTIALVSYDSVQRGARDTRRMSDLSSIQAALEQYHADQGYYPQTLSAPGSALTNPLGTKSYMSKIPGETRPGPAAYPYTAKPNSCNNTTIYCTNYCLYATTENPSSAKLAPICGGGTSQYQTQAP